MVVIDLNQRKIALISRLIGMEDQQVIKKVEELLSEVFEPQFEMSDETLKYRAAKVQKDIDNGNVLSQEEAERESENW